MGADGSKDLKPQQMDDLKNQTSFSGREIRDWYKKFHQDCPTGQMSKDEFIAMYGQLFPKGQPQQFAEHIFRAYDRDGNGVIDFREFLCTLSVSSRGSIDEKLRWAFHMYDLDGSGSVSKKEVTEIFKSIYQMKGTLAMAGQTMSPEEGCDELFEHLDKNRDETLSEMEFILGAKASPMVISLLEPGDREKPE